MNHIDESIESFSGNYNEILYLIAFKQKNTQRKNELFDKIINDVNISSPIKERIKKLNEFEKY